MYLYMLLLFLALRWISKQMWQSTAEDRDKAWLARDLCSPAFFHWFLRRDKPETTPDPAFRLLLTGWQAETSGISGLNNNSTQLCPKTSPCTFRRIMWADKKGATAMSGHQRVYNTMARKQAPSVTLLEVKNKCDRKWAVHKSFYMFSKTVRHQLRTNTVAWARRRNI